MIKMKNLFNFAVISDPQINVLTTHGNIIGKDCDTLCKSFKNMKTDAVIVCGDITENRLDDEWGGFYNAFKNNCPAKELYIAPGNMDNVYDAEGEREFCDYYIKYMGSEKTKTYFAAEYDNCILTGITPEPYNNGDISPAQYDVLRQAVQSGAERSVPVFVFSHHQLSNTIDIDWNATSNERNDENVKNILEKHGGKVLYFSGHTHRGLTKDGGKSYINVNNVHYFSTPSICKPDVTTHGIDNRDEGTGFYVELQENCVNVCGYDFLRDKFIDEFKWII